MSKVIGFDIGGTLSKAVAMEDETIVCSAAEPTITMGASVSPQAVLDFMKDFVDRVVAASPISEPIGLAVPGYLNRYEGVVVLAGNLGWQNLPLLKMAEDRLRRRVTFAHDVRAAAFAELKLGALRGVGDALYVSIGTGIGSAVVLGGVIHEGFSGQCGELGHIPVSYASSKCGCGGYGCLETIASGSALVAAMKASDASKSQGGLTFPLEAAAEGSARARLVVERALNALAETLASSIRLLDPEIVVLGGGVGCADARLMQQPIEDRVSGQLKTRIPPAFRTADLGLFSGAVGAALLARSYNT